MPDSICVDASLVVALVQDEPASTRIDALWTKWATEGRRLVAPRILRFEVAGVLDRKVRAGELDRSLARMALSAAEALATAIDQVEITGGLETAWDVAGAYRLGLLDACYLAIARQENAMLWTLDREFARRTRGKTP